MPRDVPSSFVEAPAHPRAAEIAILDRMAELLATPDRWCKNQLRRDVSGIISHCLLGALNVVDLGVAAQVQSLKTRSKAATNVMNRMVACLDYDNHIVSFNNARKTRHPDILALIRRTSASFEAER